MDKLNKARAEKQRRQEKNDNYNNKVHELVEPYLNTLAKKYHHLKKQDDYGNLDFSDYVDELNYFFDKMILGRWYFEEGDRANVVRAIIDLVGKFDLEQSEKLPLLSTDVETLDPIEFEHYCSDLLEATGWTSRVTKSSGDQGIDIIASFGNIKAVFQCKKYSNPVGNSSVQEILAGKAFEGAHLAVVVTNSTFTPAAKKLANVTNVFLLHHTELPSFPKMVGLIEE